jgi:very-short-patch-repair endonuclease
MPARVSKERTAFARSLRREMTVAETILWRSLRGGQCNGLKFRRQVPVGPYVADFLCVEHRLIVELDGPPHQDEGRKFRDAKRDDWLRERGYRVLRFGNELVIGGGDIVLERIRPAIER